MTESPRRWSAGSLRTARPALRFVLLLSLLATAFAQRPHPASWTLNGPAAPVAPGGELLLKLDLTLTEPWHMYSMTTPPGGPIATTIKLEDSPSVASWSVFQPPAERKFDPNFGIDTDTYEKNVRFYLKVLLKPDAATGPLELSTRMRYQLCTDKECMPPKPMTAKATVQVASGAVASGDQIPPEYAEYKPGIAAAGVNKAGAPTPANSGEQPQDLGSFLALAFGFGLAAIFTPCVFPMIPITVSFFLNQGGSSRGAAISQALVFCFGIILLFSGLGLGLTAALGPASVLQLASSVWVNAFIALVFFVFGLSLLGAFEITLPSGLLTKMDSASNRGGYLGTLLMGLTFSLTAFACVGPFVGTLLAASVQSGGLRPALGMVTFAAGLAAPFFLLALFPDFLKKLPRSGGWMARIKIVMGFLILAAMLKYLSTVDQILGWNLLTRERFLGLWVVLLALPGLYLLGFLRMEGFKPDDKVGASRLILATLFLGFALGLIPGMFGARLGELEPFVPPPSEGASFGPGGAGSTTAKWIKNDYIGALEKARAENKPLIISFTGYACTNCKWMKANMFTKPEVAQALDHFVLLELYTDGTDAASEANQKRQEQNYQTVAIPFYAIVDGNESTLATFAGLTKNQSEFLAFLAKRPQT